MAKNNNKAPPPAPIKNLPSKRASTVTKSAAKALKRGWRNEVKQGGKRSLRAYALEADGGSGWFSNKRAK